MAVGIDEYKVLKSEEKIALFDELFKLKAEKKTIEDRIKELEAGYKDDVIKAGRDLFFELPSGVKFSIKKSSRKGKVNTDKIMEDYDGLDIEEYRGKSSTIYTLRKDS